MSKFALITNFLGSLLPVVFPDKEFKPQRLIAVVVLMILVAVFVHFMGAENTDAVIDLTKDAMKLTTE